MLTVITQGGRMKDFWDIHKLMEKFSIRAMIDLYLEKYPYGHTES